MSKPRNKATSPSERPLILALDLGKTMGWAALLRGDRFECGYQMFNHDLPERLSRFDAWVASHSPMKALAYEKPYNLKSWAATSLFAMQGVLLCYCHKACVEHHAYSPATIKLTCAGNGRANKKDMLDWARGRGFTMSKADVADALGVLHTHLLKTSKVGRR